MPSGVYVRSEDHKIKISLAKRGKHTSPNTEFKKGNKVNYKPRICKKCGIKFIPLNPQQGYCGSKTQKNGCSWILHKGKYQSLEYKEGRRERQKTQGYKDKRKEYRKNPKEIYKIYLWGAKTRNIFWYLSFEEFMTFWQKPCYYCGSEIETIGIDRRNNSEGYSIENCVPCCWQCNKIKNSYPEEEFINHCVKITEYQKNQRAF